MNLVALSFIECRCGLSAELKKTFIKHVQRILSLHLHYFCFSRLVWKNNQSINQSIDKICIANGGV